MKAPRGSPCGAKSSFGRSHFLRALAELLHGRNKLTFRRCNADRERLTFGREIKSAPVGLVTKRSICYESRLTHSGQESANEPSPSTEKLRVASRAPPRSKTQLWASIDPMNSRQWIFRYAGAVANQSAGAILVCSTILQRLNRRNFFQYGDPDVFTQITR